MTGPSAELSYATFAELLHTAFQVSDADATAMELTLTEVTMHGAEATTFSLIFTGPLDRFLPQRTYLFEHEKLSPFQLFIVPIGKDAKGFQYEAVFNRPKR
jgi:hypothetical protein